MSYWKGQDVGQLAESIQHKGNDSKRNVGSQNAKGGNADKVAEELLLLDGQSGIKYYWGQEVSASHIEWLLLLLVYTVQFICIVYYSPDTLSAKLSYLIQS